MLPPGFLSPEDDVWDLISKCLRVYLQVGIPPRIYFPGNSKITCMAQAVRRNPQGLENLRDWLAASQGGHVNTLPMDSLSLGEATSRAFSALRLSRGDQKHHVKYHADQGIERKCCGFRHA